MTIRAWIVVTGVVAVLMGCERLVERRSFFLGQAEKWASRAYDYGENRGFICFSDTSPGPERLTTFCDRVRDMSVEQERNYRFAADHPWLSVEPDPDWPQP